MSNLRPFFPKVQNSEYSLAFIYIPLIVIALGVSAQSFAQSGNQNHTDSVSQSVAPGLAKKPCPGDGDALGALVKAQGLSFVKLGELRGIEARRSDRTIEEVKNWSVQSPTSAFVIFAEHQGRTCAWLWNQHGTYAFPLSELPPVNDLIAKDLQTMNLSGRAARAVTTTAPRDSVHSTLKRWQGEWLSPELVRALRQAERIVLLPTGALAQLPWNALLIDALGLKDKAVSVVVAADINSAIDLKLAWEPINKSDKVLVVGNPDYNGELPQLPGAEAEARFYERTYNVKAFIGKEATVDRVVHELKDASVAFLATHGFSDSKAGIEGGAVALTGGRLNARAIQTMKFEKLPLIVLSACETGLGQTHAAGTIGLTRAFQLAGAFGVVMSLWSVDDLATQLLMQHFVEEMKTASPSLALVRAQLRLRITHSDPRHWGAFAYFGTPLTEPRP